MSTVPTPIEAVKKASAKRAKVTPMPLSMESALQLMNSQVCYIESTSEIARIDPAKLSKLKIPTMSCSTFANEAFRNVLAEKEYVAKRWMEWPARRTAHEIVYEPGEPRFTADGNLNAWFPSTSVPKAGPITPWHDYLAGLMESAPSYTDWVIAWLAHHLQYPNQKILSALIFWSAEQGNGKSTLGWTMREVYGKHNSALIRNRLPERFNSFYENIQFAWFDEMMPMRKLDHADMVKSMVTQETATIEHKGRKPYEVRDIASIFITSNHENVCDLKPEDRRMMVHNVGRNSLSQSWFKHQFWPWLRQRKNIAAIHHYLLHEVDLTKPIIGGDPDSLDPAPFSPSAWAPRTDARLQMIADNRDDIESFLYELRENPRHVLGEDRPDRTIFTGEELFTLYREKTLDLKPTKGVFEKRLKRELFKLCRDQPVNFSPTFRPRLYSIDRAKAEWDMAQVKLCWAQERGDNLC